MPTRKQIAQRRKQLASRKVTLSQFEREFQLTADDGTTLEFTAGEEGKLPKFSSLAYTGKVVEKYGMRIVINVAGLSFKDTIPFIADHDPSMRIGHGKVTRSNNQVRFEGEISSSSSFAESFLKDSKNGFPFEASVGVKSQSTRYIPEKQKVNVNGLDLVGPLVVIEKGRLREVSAVTLGADDDTTSTALSASRGAKNMDELLLKFLEAEFGFSQEDFESMPEKAQHKFEDAFKLSQEGAPDTELNDDDEVDDKKKTGGLSQQDFHRWSEVLEMTNGNYALAREAIDRGLSDEEVKDKIDLDELRKNRSKMPDKKKSEDARSKEYKITVARLMSGLNINANEKPITFDKGEDLVRYFKDEEIVDRALDLGSLGLKESIAMFANMHPKSTGGFTCYSASDTSEAMRFLAHQNSLALAGSAGSSDMVQLSFNAGLMPNAFQSMCRIAMVERLRLDPQCTPALFARGQNSNLLPTPRMRINAGEKWKKLGEDGKLRYLGFGEEEFWQTWLCTRGGILTFKEDDAINDNMGMIEQIIAATVEMGDTEDWEFFTDFYNSEDEAPGPNAFWTPHNSLSGPAAMLDHTKMEESYANMQEAMMSMSKKTLRKGKDEHKISVGTSFALLYGCNLEFDVWKLFQDDSPCLDCEVNSWRSYFRGKLKFVKCTDMDNEALYGEQAGKKNWALINTNRSVAPYENTTLRGSRGARVESIALPADCLGFGTRFWKRSRLNRMDPCGILRARP